jgi:6-phosphogluconolactonase (cycloisomerase 2 family)
VILLRERVSPIHLRRPRLEFVFPGKIMRGIDSPTTKIALSQPAAAKPKYICGNIPRLQLTSVRTLMNSARLARFLLFAPILLSVAACGGSGGSSSGGGNPPPSSTEILYAANTANALFALEIDQTTGALTQTASVSPGGGTVSNSALALTPAGSFLYAVNDTTSGLNGYSTGKAGTLTSIAGSPFPILPAVQPAWPVVLALAADPQGRFLYAGTGAGFGGIASFSIDSSSGALTATGGPFSTGVGTMPAGIAINPAGTFLYATDQEQSVWAFSIDSQTGALTPLAGSPYNAGSQPYGVQVDPAGHFLYVALSNGNGIAAFSINAGTGVLSPVPGSPFPTSSMQVTQTYRLTIHPSGKFLYAFNLNGSTVAAFTIDSTSGALSPISGSPFAVAPSAGVDLTVDPSGKFLYMSLSGDPPSAFVLFDIDPNTGGLTPDPLSPLGGADQPWGLTVARFQ